MPVSLQVTLAAGLNKISSHGIGFKQMIVQNNSADSTVRLGGTQIIAGAYGTGFGILILATGSANWGPTVIQGGLLSNWNLVGATNTVIDVTYEPA